MLALSSGKLHKGGTPDLLSAARVVLNDWNAQKVPYWSEPPDMKEHPSNKPDTVSATMAAKYGLVGDKMEGEAEVIVPGAEDVGQAKIVSGFAPAFDLGGLFSQADAGAFEGEGASADCEMQDGDQEGVVKNAGDDVCVSSTEYNTTGKADR